MTKELEKNFALIAILSEQAGKEGDGMNLYISDLHFGHKNVIAFDG